MLRWTTIHRFVESCLIKAVSLSNSRLSCSSSDPVLGLVVGVKAKPQNHSVDGANESPKFNKANRLQQKPMFSRFLARKDLFFLQQFAFFSPFLVVSCGFILEIRWAMLWVVSSLVMLHFHVRATQAHHPKADVKGESTEVLDPMVKPISRWWWKSFVKVKKSWKNIGKKKWRTCLV